MGGPDGVAAAWGHFEGAGGGRRVYVHAYVKDPAGGKLADTHRLHDVQPQRRFVRAQRHNVWAGQCGVGSVVTVVAGV